MNIMKMETRLRLKVVLKKRSREPYLHLLDSGIF